MVVLLSLHQTLSLCGRHQLSFPQERLVQTKFGLKLVKEELMQNFPFPKFGSNNLQMKTFFFFLLQVIGSEGRRK